MIISRRETKLVTRTEAPIKGDCVEFKKTNYLNGKKEERKEEEKGGKKGRRKEGGEEGREGGSEQKVERKRKGEESQQNKILEIK